MRKKINMTRSLRHKQNIWTINAISSKLQNTPAFFCNIGSILVFVFVFFASRKAITLAGCRKIEHKSIHGSVVTPLSCYTSPIICPYNQTNQFQQNKSCLISGGSYGMLLRQPNQFDHIFVCQNVCKI